MTLEVRVQLRDVTPAVWRRLLVPGDVKLPRLAEMLIAAMGWNGTHLHCFEISGTRFSCPDNQWPAHDEVDESDVTLRDALEGQQRFSFEYDFGDDWRHRIDVERVLLAPIGLKAAVCVAGKNACPPDDCGGAPGYQMLLETLADASHDEYDQMLEWIGGSFDPTEFDLVATNIVLQHT
jgi:Plasmid pRiA4b ORF-3-like protein